MQIENKMSADTRVNAGNSPVTTNTSTFVDANLQNFLEIASKAKENASKVVDENGEPLFWGLLEELLFEPRSHRDIVEAIHCVGYRYCYHKYRRTHPHAGRGGRIGIA